MSIKLTNDVKLNEDSLTIGFDINNKIVNLSVVGSKTIEWTAPQTCIFKCRGNSGGSGGSTYGRWYFDNISMGNLQAYTSSEYFMASKGQVVKVESTSNADPCYLEAWGLK